MPLYLDEIWLDWRDANAAQRTLDLFAGMGTDTFSFPPGVRLVAGPWFSNEEPKIILILDIQDHTTTFPAFGMAMAVGVIARRRLTPIVEWTAVRDLLATLPSGRSG
jgi:hypothetical protein